MTIDKEILSKILARDESGISLLYKHYSSSLFGIASRVLNNNAFAEDALQKAFLKIWNNIEKYDSDKSTLFTWMASIVRNTAIDIKRLKSFQIENKSETFDTTVHNSGSTFIDTASIDTQKMIDGLDDKYAIVLDYLYLRGYSQRELSDELDIPIGTIKTRVKKGINVLREKLDKEKGLFIGALLFILLIIVILL